MFPCCSSSLGQIQISRGSWLGNQNEKRKEGCRFFDIPARRRWISLSIKEHRRKKTNTVCSAVSFWKLGRTKLQNKCPFPFPAPRAEGSLENCLFLAQAGIHDLFIVPWDEWHLSDESIKRQNVLDAPRKLFTGLSHAGLWQQADTHRHQWQTSAAVQDHWRRGRGERNGGGDYEYIRLFHE